jgi:hypothetical protein
MNIITDNQAKEYIESGRYLVVNEAGFYKSEEGIIAFNFHTSNDHVTVVSSITDALRFISC